MGDRWLVILTELAGVTESTGGVGRRYAAMLPRLRGQGVDPVVLLFPDSPLRDGHFTNASSFARGRRDCLAHFGYLCERLSHGGRLSNFDLRLSCLPSGRELRRSPRGALHWSRIS